MDIKDIIKSKREELNLTLEELGNLVGVGKSTIRKWETGMIENMRRDNIVALSKALNISPSVLMGWEEYESEKYNSNNEKNKLTEDEKTIIELYRQLDIEEKIELKGELKGIIKTKQKERVKKEQKQA